MHNRIRTEMLWRGAGQCEFFFFFFGLAFDIDSNAREKDWKRDHVHPLATLTIESQEIILATDRFLLWKLFLPAEAILGRVESESKKKIRPGSGASYFLSCDIELFFKIVSEIHITQCRNFTNWNKAKRNLYVMP